MGSRLDKTSSEVRKRIENHSFDNEEGEEYDPSAFGGFGDYFRRKKIKLQNLDVELRSQAGDRPQIFRGIVAHINGYTQPSLNDLHKMIVQHGGGFMQYLDGKTMVTHIIASNLTPKKAVEFRKYRIVKPAWVVESVKAGKLLPWEAFRVVDEGPRQKVLSFNNGGMSTQTNTPARGYREESDRSWYTKQLKNQSPGGMDPPRQSQSSKYRTQRSSAVEDVSDSDEEKKPSAVPQSTPHLIRDLRQIETAESEGYLEPHIQAQALKQLELVPSLDVPSSPHDAEDTNLGFEGDAAEIVTEVQDARTPEPESNKRAHDSDIDVSPSKRRKLTAEEHNAILLSDPNIRKTTVVNPGFLEQYYRESRLHHLSTWKADLKAQLQAMADEKTASQKRREKRPAHARRYILHVDFDSFFAAVSLKKHPQYKDKPVAIAHSNGSASEIASCNYPAREFGAHNGMWMKRALELCPELKVLPYDFPAYEEASRAFYESVIATGGVIQSVSIDEVLVDATMLCAAAAGTDAVKRNEGGVDREQAEADQIARQVRDDVRARTGCEVSVGIGGNILLAKLALRKAKPAGQYQVCPEEVLDFIGPLEVQKLPGVAHSTGGKLEELGIKLVRDIREVTRDRLTTALGPKTGERLWECARGIDRKEVGDVEIRKSVSAEVNWGVRFVTQEQVDEFMENIGGELHSRLLKEKVKGKQLSLKIMKRAADAPLDPPKHLGHGKCDTFNKSLILGVATNAKEIIAKETILMLKSFGISPGELRGIGVQMTKLEPLKPEGKPDSSQRLLQFKPKSPPRPPPSDPDDVATPTKPKVPADRVGFGAPALNQPSPSRKPLNTSGTQFILPTQVDPSVLAELPADIRARFVNRLKGNPKPADAPAETRPSSPPPPPNATPRPFTLLPAESQLDPATLNELPPDVRAEVLAFYNQRPNPTPPQSPRRPAPQSPRRPRPLSKRPPPQPRRRGRPPKSAARPPANATLTQAFISARPAPRAETGGSAPGTDTDGDDQAAEDGIDPQVLAELPPDIRAEVLAEQARLRARTVRPAPRSATRDTATSLQRFVSLPPRPPRPTFTPAKLGDLREIREAVTGWVREFRDEGPYEEDVDALGTYLARVVREEGDMAKAVAVVKWLRWVVEEYLIEGGDARGAWETVVGGLAEGLRGVVREMGRGEVDV
ncbi:DNA repair protein [Trichodelitschia bisporula]|uniref:DNA repair protein REV1 n=1 Tax=Trichodelitschia bisporula TaxID=703511 RepID=A0A6G1I2L0_9PEZI|nr:DNA repair protein [Trichodelitschia bisporula]